MRQHTIRQQIVLHPSVCNKKEHVKILLKHVNSFDYNHSVKLAYRYSFYVRTDEPKLFYSLVLHLNFNLFIYFVQLPNSACVHFNQLVILD